MDDIASIEKIYNIYNINRNHNKHKTRGINYKYEIIKMSYVFFLLNIMATWIGYIYVGITYEVLFLYYIYSFIPFFIHVGGHTRISRHWFNQHTIHHHIRMFPYHKFENVTYRNEIPWYKNGNTFYYLGSALLGVLLISNSINKALFLTGYVIILLQRENILHNEIHKSNSVFKNYKFYIVYKKLHRIHHMGSMNKNYAFSEMFFDYIYGTLQLPVD
jgi:hypothetical protein